LLAGGKARSVEGANIVAARLVSARAGKLPAALWFAYWIFLLLLLAAELIALTPPLDTSRVEQTSFWIWFWVAVLHQIRPALVTGLLAVAFLSWPVVQDEFLQSVEQSEGRPANSIPWLSAHLILVGVLFTAKALRTTNPAVSLAETKIWLSLWVVMALPVFATWATAALPPRFWVGWFMRSRWAFLAGAAFGVAADFLGGSTEALWWPLQRLSFRIVVLLLGLLRQTTIADPHRFIIGTPDFSVQIWAACSGLEGVGLISAFLVAYLWLYRQELRFPQALLLFPVGAIAIWLMNAVRITALILIGSRYPEIGFKGFHSVAGWLFFNLIACGLIWTSWRFSLFTKPEARPANSSVSNPAAVNLVPLLAIITVSMITRAFSAGFEVLYPLRVFAAVGAFWFYRRELAAMQWKASYFAVVLGVLVFLLWIALAHPGGTTEAAADAALGSLPAYLGAGWLFFRIAGSVITVPLAEELAFRGYLIRKLVSYDFVPVALGQFTWGSFLGSSILFGALHGEWLGGTLAGMIFAIALYRRGLLSDAVLAHATANGLLSAYVLATHNWSLWN